MRYPLDTRREPGQCERLLRPDRRGLFGAFAACGVEVIEVFPTASWTRWQGMRGSQTRAAWTRPGLAALGLAGVPETTNQDPARCSGRGDDRSPAQSCHDRNDRRNRRPCSPLVMPSSPGRVCADAALLAPEQDDMALPACWDPPSKCGSASRAASTRRPCKLADCLCRTGRTY